MYKDLIEIPDISDRVFLDLNLVYQIFLILNNKCLLLCTALSYLPTLQSVFGSKSSLTNILNFEQQMSAALHCPKLLTYIINHFNFE